MKIRPDFDISANGDHASFIAASNILDLALAAGECGQALREDFGCDTDATKMAEEFVRNVHKAPTLWSDTGIERYTVANSSPREWASRHERFLEEAAHLLSLLTLNARVATGHAHLEPLARLRSKVEQGRKDTRQRADGLDAALAAALETRLPALSSN